MLQRWWSCTLLSKSLYLTSHLWCSHLIQDHPSFHNNSQLDQWPIPYQLAIALFWFGHFGSAGTVINATRRVITAFLPLHDQAIWWPNVDEKQEASDWVESVSCHAWRLGFCMVDGTLIPLASKPGHFGEQFFDCKSNYSLSLMVSTLHSINYSP